MNLNQTPLWTSEEAVQATQGSCNTSWQASGVSIDSRTVEPGDMFIALTGPNHDGHQFIGKAFGNGAAAAVIQTSERPTAEMNFEQAHLLSVENTNQALEKLAGIARRRTTARVIAVTGSVGKTGTKEMLRLVFSGQGMTTATSGNLNNHFGLPLSLARMPKETEFGVFELGMSAPGEIEPLAKMAKPHVALITSIEAAHSEFFNSVDEIADAKAEIFKGLEPDGTAVLNADNPMIDRLSMRAAEAGIGDVRTFGEAENADCKLLDLIMTSTSSQAVINLRGKQIRFEMRLPGRHWVQNALGVLCAVDACGADPHAAAIKLKEMSGLKGRGRHHAIPIPGGAFTLIDESYNASPASVRAAIEVLGRAPTLAGGRKIAVLGDMLELGDQAVSLHESLADELIDNRIDLVFTTGPYMASLSSALPAAMRGGHADTAQTLSPLVQSIIRSGDVVTIKGSFGSRTALIVEELLNRQWNVDGDPSASLVVNGN